MAMCRKYLLISLLNIYCYVNAQDISLEISKDNIVIGEQFDLNLMVKAKKDDKVIFPSIEKSIPPFEIIREKKIDSINKQDFIEYIKKYTLTSFDSGYHEIKPFRIMVNDNTIKTAPRWLMVNTVEVDTVKKQIYDIKSNLTPSYSIYEYWEYFIILLVILIILGIILYFLLRKKRGEDKKIIKIYVSPYEEAMTELNKLKDENLITKGKYKLYYSKLTDLLRVYLEKTFKFKAMELTSYEILKQLDKKKLSRDILNTLSFVLENSDLAKFAKFIPKENIAQMDFENIRNIINNIKDLKSDETV